MRRMTINGTGQRISIRVEAADENHCLFCSGSAKRKNGFLLIRTFLKTQIMGKMVGMARFELETSASTGEPEVNYSVFYASFHACK